MSGFVKGLSEWSECIQVEKSNRLHRALRSVSLGQVRRGGSIKKNRKELRKGGGVPGGGGAKGHDGGMDCCLRLAALGRSHTISPI